MKTSGYILVLIIVLQMLFLSGCPENASTLTDANQSDSYSILRSPFNGNGNWYLTQAFGAYYDFFSGHHPAEDWNLASGDDDKNESVYAIAPGEVIDSGQVMKSDEDGSESGFYLVIKHEGQFIIPASQGSRIFSLTKPDHEEGRGSNKGLPMLYAKDLFSEGNLIHYDLGEKTQNGTYSYPASTVSTIYSVYMHINKPDIPVGTKITNDMLNKPIGSLMGGMTLFKSHLHFEIRIGDNDEDVKGSVLSEGNGYFANSQDMVNLGYREPSSIIQANGGQGCIVGEILGTKTNTSTSTAVVTETTTDLINEARFGVLKRVYRDDISYYLEIDYIDWLFDEDEIIAALKEDAKWDYSLSADDNLSRYNTGDCLNYIRNRNSKLRTFKISEEAILGIQSYSYNDVFHKEASDYDLPDYMLGCTRVSFEEFAHYSKKYLEIGLEIYDIFSIEVKNSEITEAYQVYFE